MPRGGSGRTVVFDSITPKEVTVRTDLKRLLLGCLLALLIVPAAASATYPMGDGPGPVSHENGARPAAPGPVASSTPTIVREVRNVTTHDGSQTFTIVLAALALSVAITGAGYVALRVRPMLRS
jgi:hypothetical protein